MQTHFAAASHARREEVAVKAQLQVAFHLLSPLFAAVTLMSNLQTAKSELLLLQQTLQELTDLQALTAAAEADASCEKDRRVRHRIFLRAAF